MKVLLLVDPQVDFCPDGALAVAGGDEIMPVINQMLDDPSFSYRIASRDWHPPGHVSFACSHDGKRAFETVPVDGVTQILWPKHCVQGEPGAEFHKDLKSEKLDFVIDKGTDPHVDSYSAFYDNARKNETPLRQLLEELASKQGLSPADITFVIGGLALDVCVAATVRDALDLGFKVELALDACRSVDPSRDKELLRELMLQGAHVYSEHRIEPAPNHTRPIEMMP